MKMSLKVADQSLLPVFSKMLEKLVYNQIADYLEANNLLNDEQHGFMQGRSTITVCINFIERIIDSAGRNEKDIGVFLDLQQLLTMLT